MSRSTVFARVSKRPGEIKIEPNRAGETLFVSPELVIGTLTKGFELISAAAPPEARAALAMFVVAEMPPLWRRQRAYCSNPEPYGKMLQRATDFSRWLDYSSQVKCFEQLHTSNALKDPTLCCAASFGAKPHGSTN
jgi:hypothetical protein